MNLKIWTSETTIDLTGAHMAQAEALDIYKIAIGGKNEAVEIITRLLEDSRLYGLLQPETEAAARSFLEGRAAS